MNFESNSLFVIQVISPIQIDTGIDREKFKPVAHRQAVIDLDSVHTERKDDSFELQVTCIHIPHKYFT
jgi:hypothetical protein